MCGLALRHGLTKSVLIFFLVFFLLVLGEQPVLSHQSEGGQLAGQPWQEWGREAFEHAQAEDKLILLDLTAVWCHACHVMDQTTYADPRVLALLQANFVAVRVDTDQRPDLEARYRSGGWPTTSLLLPTGEILFQANSVEPEVMVELLQEAKVLYDSEKEGLRQQAAQLWNRVKDRTQTNQLSSEVLRPSMASHSVEMMKNEFDVVNGGFRDHPKFFEPEAIQMALSYGFFEQDVELIHMGLTTLEKQVALLDPVWGGFYRYAEQADWSQPHFEKMLTIQAQNLLNYVMAFQYTGNTEFKYIAERIIDYVESFLTDSQTGQFLESQDADVRDQTGKTLVPGSEYFPKGLIHRMALGMPRLDTRMYTGSNAEIALAYLQASEVFGKPELQAKALHVLQLIVSERFDPKEGLAHGIRNDSLGIRGILSDHIRLGLALLEAFRQTEDFTFLQQAEELSQSTQVLLEDEKGGGFFDRLSSSENLGLLNIPTKPARENIQASRLYGKLFHLTGKDGYRATAERALQSVVGIPQPLPVALVGLAVDEWFRPPVHIAVVGKPDDKRTKALLDEAGRLYCPGKMVKIFDPQKEAMQWGDISFPDTSTPSAFICTDQLCLSPVSQPKAMKERLNELLIVLRESVL